MIFGDKLFNILYILVLNICRFLSMTVTYLMRNLYRQFLIPSHKVYYDLSLCFGLSRLLEICTLWLMLSWYFSASFEACRCVKCVQIRSFFWSLFSRIRTEYGEIRSISPYSVQMRENTDQKKLPIWTLFTHCVLWYSYQDVYFLVIFLDNITSKRWFSKVHLWSISIPNNSSYLRLLSWSPLKFTLIYLVHLNHFFTRDLKYVIRRNVRTGKCHLGNCLSEKCPFGESSVRGTFRRGNVFEEKSVGEKSVG